MRSYDYFVARPLLVATALAVSMATGCGSYSTLEGGDCVDRGSCDAVAIGSGGGSAMVLTATSVEILSQSVIGSINKDLSGGLPIAQDGVYAGPIANDGAYVYFGSEVLGPPDDVRGLWGIGRCSVRGCGPLPSYALAGDVPFTGLAVDGARVFATEASKLLRTASDGSGPVDTLVSGLDEAGSLVLDDAFVYYAASGTVGRVAKDAVAGSATPEIVYGSADHPHSLILDGASIVWVAGDDSGRVELAPKSGVTAGSGPTILADALHTPIAIAIDEAHLYIAERGTAAGSNGAPFDDGRILACPRSGCLQSKPVVLVSNQHEITAIAVDEKAVYWLTAETFVGYSRGQVMQVLKH